jgi:hypothetical protein
VGLQSRVGVGKIEFGNLLNPAKTVFQGTQMNVELGGRFRLAAIQIQEAGKSFHQIGPVKFVILRQFAKPLLYEAVDLSRLGLVHENSKDTQTLVGDDLVTRLGGYPDTRYGLLIAAP